MITLRRLPAAAFLALLTFCAATPMPAQTTATLPSTRPQRPVVALLTDFGLQNEAVGLCHGAILAVDSNIQIVDLSHNPEAYDILLGALMLRGTTVFPKGSVFVGVIDPGVGTSRQPIAVRTKQGYYYVGPNNGLLTYVLKDQGVEQVVALDERRINPQWQPGTFDGRDLFSPAGALLATSGGDLTRIGRPIDSKDLVLLSTPAVTFEPSAAVLQGVFLREDTPYGNVWTNITQDDLTSAGIRLGDKVRVQGEGIDVTAPFVVSFGHVPEGQPLSYIASHGTLAFALNMGNFREKHQMKPGMPLRISKAR